MKHVLTLVSPEIFSLKEPVFDTVAQAVVASGYEIAERRWLAPGHACDLLIARQDHDGDAIHETRAVLQASLDMALSAALASWPVDMVLQPYDIRRRRLLLADMESTLIVQELLDEMATLLGIHDKVAVITRRAMNAEIDFASALRERVGLMQGLPEQALEDLAERITLMPGAATLVATLTADGIPCYIATGGFSFFAERVARRLGCAGFFANQLDIEAGILTGRVRDPVLDKSAKRATLEQLARNHGLTLAATAAVGDGANDAEMLRAAGLGIGFHPKPALAAQIRSHIRHTDLTTLLFAQGYQLNDFARTPA